MRRRSSCWGSDGVGRVVNGKSGVFTVVGSGQPGKSMLRGWGWTVRELGAYQYHHSHWHKSSCWLA
jgi:outer membrane cobalamin receptor